MDKISGRRERGVVASSSTDDAIAKLVKISVDRTPESLAERDLVGDTFLSMLKAEPKTLDEVPIDRTANKALVDWMLDETDRSNTIGNVAASVITSGLMWSALTNDASIKAALDKQKEAEEAQKKAESYAKSALDLAERIANGDADEGAEEVVNDMLDTANEMQDKAKELVQQAMQAIDKQKADPIKQKAMKVAARKAEKAAREVNDLMEGWGASKSGLYTSSEIELLSSLVNRNEYQDLSRLLGRARGIAHDVFSSHTRDEKMSEVSFTRSISSLFESEIADITSISPLWLRAKKIRQLMQTGLLGWKQLESKTSSGSFIALIDESGSVGESGCQIEKSIALGIAKEIGIVEENRYYELVGFSHHLGKAVRCDDGWAEHVAWGSSYMGGGTSFNIAIGYALDRIEQLEDDGVEGVDILFVTDGEDSLSHNIIERLNDAKERMALRFIYVNVGYEAGANPVLKELAHAFINVDSSEALEDMFESLVEQVATLIAEIGE